VFAGGSRPLSWLWPRLGHAARKPRSRISPRIGYQAAPMPTGTRTLLLKDFNPVSMLHVRCTRWDQAKFYVIDVHNT